MITYLDLVVQALSIDFLLSSPPPPSPLLFLCFCSFRYSGPTIHYVDEEYDRGRILAQRVVPVLANDTAEDLAARVLHEEHRLYEEVVEALCEERILWREDGVPLIRSKENPDHYS